MTDLLTKAEAAEWLGLSVDTLETIIKSGKLPIYRISPRMIRIHRQDLVRYVEGCRVEPAKAGGRKGREPAPRICGYIPGMDVV